MRSIFRRILYLFRRDEMEEEMRLHRELRAARLREAGVADPEGAARKLFGNSLHYREQSRDVWTWAILESVLQDVRYAFRQVRKNPLFTFVAVSTLALGIGADTAIFSLVNQILLHPAGINDPDRLVAVRERYDKLNLKSINVSPPTFADARGSRHVFQYTAVARTAGFNYTAPSGPEQLEGSQVSSEWFDVFGAKPVLGRVFVPEEDQPNTNHVVVLSYQAWHRLFGSDRSILGRPVELNQEPYRVIGVMEPTFRWPTSTELWVPLGLPSQQFSPRNRFNESLEAVARLQPGVPFARASAWLQVLTDRVWNAGTPGSKIARNNGWGMFGVPYIELISQDTKRPVLVLFGAVGALLLIACAKIAGLLLARTSARSFEMTVRAALGASQARLRQQTISECVLLSTAGAAAGIGLAYGGIRLLLKIAPEKVSGGLGARLDSHVLLFTAVLAIISGIGFGLLPAWRAASVQANGALRGAGRSTSGPDRHRFRSVLVIVEGGLALALLVTAGLFLQSFARLQNVDPGFKSRGVTTAMFSLPSTRYPSADRQAVFYRAVLERLASTPGVSSAAIGLGLPFTPFGDAGAFNIQGTTIAPGDPLPQSERRYVTPGYFRALTIPVVRGRGISEADDATSEPVALIDETLARQYWPNEDPLEQRIRLTSGPAVYKVIGIVGHVIGSNLAADSGKGAIYLNLFQMIQPAPVGWVVVKSAPGMVSPPAAIRAAVHEADPSQPIRSVTPLGDLVSASLAPRTFVSWLLGLFAVLALLMAMLGLYGVVSYSVTEQTREFGIRIALGGSRWCVLRSVLNSGVRLALAGTVLGLVGSLMIYRALRSELFEVRQFDPLLFLGMAAALLAASLLASYLPARRAVRVDPIVTLRYE